MDNLRGSEIDLELENPVSDEEGSDIEDVVDCPDFELEDFSDGSDYIPNDEELDSSDAEDVGRPNPTIRELSPGSDNPSPPRPTQGLEWTRVYPPEEEEDISLMFKVRHHGVRGNIEKNKPPIYYALLFFTGAFWKSITDQTNAHANENFENKRGSGNLKKFSRIKKWVDVTISEMKSTLL